MKQQGAPQPTNAAAMPATCREEQANAGAGSEHDGARDELHQLGAHAQQGDDDEYEPLRQGNSDAHVVGLGEIGMRGMGQKGSAG